MDDSLNKCYHVVSLVAFFTDGLSLTAADGDQGIRESPPSHNSVKAATKAARAQPAASHGTSASTGYTEAPERLKDHDGSAVNAAAGEQGRWQQDNDDITTEHGSSEAAEEQLSFGAASPEGPPRRATRANGATSTPEVLVKEESGAEPQIIVKTSTEFAAENRRDRIKRQASWDAEKTDRDTDGGKRWGCRMT